MQYINSLLILNFVFYILSIILITYIVSIIRNKLSIKWKNVFSLNIIWCVTAWELKNKNKENTPSSNIIHKAAVHVLSECESKDIMGYNNTIKSDMLDIISTLENDDIDNNIDLKRTVIDIAKIYYQLYNNSIIQYIGLECRYLLSQIGLPISPVDKVILLTISKLKEARTIVERYNDIMTECSKCKGTGYILTKENTQIVCKLCRGTGLVKKHNEYLTE